MEAQTRMTQSCWTEGSIGKKGCVTVQQTFIQYNNFNVEAEQAVFWKMSFYLLYYILVIKFEIQ